MEQVRLCAVWPTENWLGSSRNHMQGWMIVWECCRHALEKECLVVGEALFALPEVLLHGLDKVGARREKNEWMNVPWGELQIRVFIFSYTSRTGNGFCHPSESFRHIRMASLTLDFHFWSSPFERAITIKADRKSQVRQCYGFCTAHFWSSLA